MRLYPDPWGRMRAVLIEERTTNLLSTSESQGFSSPITKTVTSGTNYTVSMTGSGSITLSGAGSGTVTASSPVTFTASSTSLTLTPSGDTGRVQLEQKPYKTSWTSGGASRAAETLTIPSSVVSVNQGTIEIWAYINTSVLTKVANRWPRIFHIARSNNNTASGLALYHADNTADWMLMFTNDSSTMYTTLVPDSYTPVGWHHFAATWNSSAVKLYIDGVLRATYNNPQLPSGFGAVSIGYKHTENMHYANTSFADLRISSIARSDAEIAVAYSSGQPLPVDEYTTFKLYPKRAKMLVV